MGCGRKDVSRIKRPEVINGPSMSSLTAKDGKAVRRHSTYPLKHNVPWYVVLLFLFSTVASLFLVEALIKRKITEAELSAAHKHVERDRKLLAQLTTKGLDVANAPLLFPKLDALFELLDSTPDDNDQ